MKRKIGENECEKEGEYKINVKSERTRLEPTEEKAQERDGRQGSGVFRERRSPAP